MAKRLAIFRKIIRFSRPWESFIFFCFMALLLEGISRAGLVSRLYFPPISRDMAVFYREMVSGVLPLEILRSFVRMFGGYFLAALAMIPLGVLMGISNRAYNLFEPVVEFFRPLPPPSIIPAAMLFLGIGNSMKIFVVFFACSFPMIINTIDGVKSVDPLLIYTARSFGLRRHQIITKVILPAATPQIMAGLRISLPISLIVTILSEMIGSVNGIGHYILRMQRTFNIPEMYAGVMMLGIIGFLLNKIFLKADRTFMAWHQGWKKAGR